MAIIKSLLDTDLYKITVQRVFLRHFPTKNAVYKFKCRNKGVKFTDEQVARIRAEINDLCELRFKEDELKWIGELYYMKDAQWFLEFLRMFKFNKDHISVSSGPDGELRIIASGPLWQVMYFETFVLAIVNEVYFEGKGDLNKARTVLMDNIGFFETSLYPIKVAEFGQRRRYSREWQEEVIRHMAVANGRGSFRFVGTSNMYFAKKFNLTAIGTFGHELVQSAQALDDVPVALSQKKAFEIWQKEYDGALGHALSDTLGDDKFFRDFGRTECKLFDGVRHDSGDPIEFGEKVIQHYKDLNIDPMTKSIVFSDSLDAVKAREINTHFNGRIGVSFGIGTSLTNNFGDGWEPLNIVMKVIEIDSRPVAKLSNNPGKIMCENESYVNYLRSAISGRYN